MRTADPQPVIAPDVGHVRIWTNDPPLTVNARLSDERPNVESGYGGWNEVARPRRRPLTTWKGLPALRLSLPILFDGWGSGTNQEGSIRHLEAMARPGGADGEPPLVRILATGNAVPHQDANWVITDLAWGEALMNEHGNRVRQQVTLSLLEYLLDALIVERSPAKRQRAAATSRGPVPVVAAGGRAPTRKPGAAKKRVVSHQAASDAFHHPDARTVTFGAGENLLSLAARELGDASRWTEIAALNGIRDPRAIALNQVLRLP